MPEITLVDAAISPPLLAEVRTLLREYEASLAHDGTFVSCLQHQRFEDELAELPGKYAPPLGRLLLARVEDAPAGCVALQPMDSVRCEMKRMYVRPHARGRSVGRALAAAVVEHARAIGYRRMLLDTLPQMREAIALYRSIGFRDTTRYHYDPVAELVFFELVL